MLLHKDVEIQSDLARSLVINLAILAFLTEVGGLHYLLSATIAIGVVTAWNYLANITYTWRLGHER
ncbi:MAG: hypothetical protein DSO02_00250 [Hadesarchaea archaeon]|nr:MAG: hypothetical protein DSO03_01735 [Hadesarchaea archaeon]TDA36530.1 MAG: hypothetical protein DSO02_00250 [Hadesarchaea archaeon]